MEMNDFKNQLSGLLATLQKLPGSEKQAALNLLQLTLKDEVQISSPSMGKESVPRSEKNSTEGKTEHSVFQETHHFQPDSQQVPTHPDRLLCVALDTENDKEPCQSHPDQGTTHSSQNIFQEKYSMDILNHFSDSRCLEDTVVSIAGDRVKLSSQKEVNSENDEDSQLVAQNPSVNDVAKDFEESLGIAQNAQLRALRSREVRSSSKDSMEEQLGTNGEQSSSDSQRSLEYESNIAVKKTGYDAHSSLSETSVSNYQEHNTNLGKYDAILEISTENKLPGSQHEAIPLLSQTEHELSLINARDFNDANQGGTELGTLLQPQDQNKNMGPMEESSSSQAFEVGVSLLTDDAQPRIIDIKKERNAKKLETSGKSTSIVFDEGSSSSFNLTNFSHITARDSLYSEDNQYLLPYLERDNYEKAEYKAENFSRKTHQESSDNSQVISYANFKYSECCQEQRELFNDFENDKSPVDLSSASSNHSSKISGSVLNLNDSSSYHKLRGKPQPGEDGLCSIENSDFMQNTKKRKQSQVRNFIKKRIHSRIGKEIIIQPNKNNVSILEGRESSVIEKNCCEIVLDSNILEKNLESNNLPCNSATMKEGTGEIILENQQSLPSPNFDSPLPSNIESFELGVNKCGEDKATEETSSCPRSTTDQIECEDVLPRNLRPVCCRTCRRELEDISLFPVHQRHCDGHLACSLCHARFVHKVAYTRHVEGHKRNVCSKCSQSFCSHKKLKAHMKSEHNYNLISKLYPCHRCSRKFLKRSSLCHHLKVHAIDNEVVCQKCGVFCKDEECYELHMADHVKSTKFHCHICSASFKRRQQYDDHLKHHKKNKCEICGQPFTTKRALVRHCRVEHQRLPQNITQDPEYKCDLCDRVFNRPSLLHQHLQLHSGVKLECGLCDKQFSHKRGLRKHMNSVVHERMLQTNNMEKDHAYDVKQQILFVCEYCGIKLPTRYMLSKHSRLKHKFGATWSCPHCDYKTKRNHTLKRHMELHQESRNFMCEICGSSFQALATLKDHHNFVHSDERNFKCTECNKCFKNNSSLARHLRIHSDDRPYQCHCGTSYKRLSHLKRHMSSAHNEILKSRAVKKFKRVEQRVYSDEEEYEVVPVSGSTLSPVMPSEGSVKDTTDILLQSQESIILMGENSNSGQGHLITVGDTQIIQLIPSTFFPQENSFQAVSLVSTNELHALPMSMSTSSSYGQGGSGGQVVVEPFCLPQNSDAMVMVPASQEDHVHLGEPDVLRTTLRTLETEALPPGTIVRAATKQVVKQEMSQQGGGGRQGVVEPFTVPQSSETMVMVSASQEDHVHLGEPNVLRTLESEDLSPRTIVRETAKQGVKQEMSLHTIQNHSELDVASNLDSYDYSSAETSTNLLPALPPARYITHTHPHSHTHSSTTQLSQDMLQPNLICSDFILPVDNNR